MSFNITQIGVRFLQMIEYWNTLYWYKTCKMSELDIAQFGNEPTKTGQWCGIEVSHQHELCLITYDVTECVVVSGHVNVELLTSIIKSHPSQIAVTAQAGWSKSARSCATNTCGGVLHRPLSWVIRRKVLMYSNGGCAGWKSSFSQCSIF